MIRLHRAATEPTALTNSRARCLPLAQEAWQRNDRKALLNTITSESYGVVRKQIYETQNGRCAFCERDIGRDGQAIEHFRPKARAFELGEGKRRTGARDHERYWWLAWSWENLLIACSTCNTGSKGNLFPMAPGAHRLPLPPRQAATIPDECVAISSENALLVNPYEDDPLEHIYWRPLDTSLPAFVWEWIPVPVPGSPKGRPSLKVLKLDKPGQGLAGQVTRHLRTSVVRLLLKFAEDIATFADPMDSAARQDVKSAWDALVSDLLDTGCMYLAARWCAIDRLVPPEVRERWSLDLPRPYLGTPPAPAPTPGDP